MTIKVEAHWRIKFDIRWLHLIPIAYALVKLVLL